MPTNTEHIGWLLKSFNDGSLKPSEQIELENWINADKRNRQLFEELTDPGRLRSHLKQMEGFDEEKAWIKISKGVSGQARTARIISLKKIAVAASVIILLGLGAYFAFFNKPGSKNDISKIEPAKDIEAPKSSMAMITLANGREISIDSLSSLSQGSVSLVKTADGRIVYTGAAKEIMYNTVSNPRGSKVIDMVLGDGSRIWLNAGSSITYPVAFVGNQRKVSMSGEAYFEISTIYDVRGTIKTPFIVEKGDMQVTVLGTHFNVNAYDDEENIKVTLIEGSVKVGNRIGETTIKPGQQASLTTNYKPQTTNSIDIEAVLAWKNGKFIFGEKIDIESIMRQVARWYDVEVEFKGKITNHFGGSISRESNLSMVLKVLETTGGVNCTIEGRKIIIRPSN